MATSTSSATCAHCDLPLPVRIGRGRRRQYCDATCRSAARRRRHNAVKESLTETAHRGALDVMVEPNASAAADVTLDTPLDRVAAAREQASVAEAALRAAVARARAAGHTWQRIGTVLGTTRQAAFERFAH